MKLVLGNATQLKAINFSKANESQSAWGYQINLKIHKNVISHKKE